MVKYSMRKSFKLMLLLLILLGIGIWYTAFKKTQSIYEPYEAPDTPPYAPNYEVEPKKDKG